MLPVNPWEHHNAMKTVYSKCIEKVCEKHGLTRMELDILLFLANNPLFDTATDIVEIRYLSKSQVSSSIKILEKRGYIEKRYTNGNRKTVHLCICDSASGIVKDGQEAQEEFLSIMFRGIPEEEIEGMRKCNMHILENIQHYLRPD